MWVRFRKVHASIQTWTTTRVSWQSFACWLYSKGNEKNGGHSPHHFLNLLNPSQPTFLSSIFSNYNKSRVETRSAPWNRDVTQYCRERWRPPHPNLIDTGSTLPYCGGKIRRVSIHSSVLHPGEGKNRQMRSQALKFKSHLGSFPFHVGIMFKS